MRKVSIASKIQLKQFWQLAAIGLATSVLLTTHQAWAQPATVLMQAIVGNLNPWAIGTACLLIITLAVFATHSLIEITWKILKHGWRETFYFPPDNKNHYIAFIVLGSFLALGTYKASWEVVTAIAPYLHIALIDSKIPSLVSCLVAFGVGHSCFQYFAKG